MSQSLHEFAFVKYWPEGVRSVHHEGQQNVENHYVVKVNPEDSKRHGHQESVENVHL